MIQIDNLPYIIGSPLDLVRIIQQIVKDDDHALYYLGLSSPSDVENCIDQAALDIARNPLIALYFACIDYGPNDGEILVYHVPNHAVVKGDITQDAALQLTERGTFVFVNDQQNNAARLAHDSLTNAPIEIIVDQAAKPHIIRELDKLGISTQTLFPEMI
ncbi:hypothetical protein PE074_02790 [Wohlfahrtiimonas chitiniclastica]|uniref:hypothetical protein n=1 Tax=Wohlfahrtiimonas chitiniclastica TaxID=400946 RepID=UPI0007B41584|nr:hypothetical protein [Wohlfahrtiimonas chitiniclastica]KZS23499.1 hypothetical protein BMY_1360 [Wohlfahrtiimonas chitiniclastica]KZX36900.1 hypothetical protein A6V30_05980 [Wohlfahrtiimonas chitiniclastica]MBS7815404.1 hypothetical protein [Wohlfahrtiimonas chitiniclastica]MBS7819257.1 hypothetical protein [Wohlfahrtiimonas chitiniclastica]MBS7821339.1 hypothetical protein [Wohlfahrtiimonas chitiniclastica]